MKETFYAIVRDHPDIKGDSLLSLHRTEADMIEGKKSNKDQYCDTENAFGRERLTLTAYSRLFRNLKVGETAAFYVAYNFQLENGNAELRYWGAPDPKKYKMELADKQTMPQFRKYIFTKLEA